MASTSANSWMLVPRHADRRRTQKRTRDQNNSGLPRKTAHAPNSASRSRREGDVAMAHRRTYATNTVGRREDPTRVEECVDTRRRLSWRPNTVGGESASSGPVMTPSAWGQLQPQLAIQTPVQEPYQTCSYAARAEDGAGPTQVITPLEPPSMEGTRPQTMHTRRKPRGSRGSRGGDKAVDASGGHNLHTPASKLKRARLDDASSSRQVKRARLTNTPKEEDRSNTDSSQSHLMVAIATLPPADLTVEQARQLKVSIEDRIIETALNPHTSEEQLFVPSFRGKPIADGSFLKMWCENERSLEWLRTTVANMQSPIPATNLNVIRQSDIPKRVRAAIWLPETEGEDLPHIHLILTAQNPWYSVNTWQLHKATLQNKGIYLTVGIPESEIPKIMERERRVAFMTGSVYVIFRSARDGGDASAVPVHGTVSNEAGGAASNSADSTSHSVDNVRWTVTAHQSSLEY